jgi:hypothetical protein
VRIRHATERSAIPLRGIGGTEKAGRLPYAIHAPSVDTVVPTLADYFMVRKELTPTPGYLELADNG